MKKLIFLFILATLHSLLSIAQFKVKTNGTVKIGSGSGLPDAGDLQVVQSSNANLRVFSTSASPARLWALNSLGSYGIGVDDTGVGRIFYNINSTPTNLISFNSSGYVGIGANPSGTYKLYLSGSAYCTGTWSSSDKRLKNDIKPIHSALSDVLRLKGVSFLYTKKEFNVISPDSSIKRSYGFIAQDVNEILPDLVRQSDDSLGTLAINYDGVIPLLVEALKEQQRMIEELKKKVENTSGLIGNSSNEDSKLSSKNEVKLYQNFPNPFSIETVIKYHIPDDRSSASIVIYNMSGKEIKAFKNLPKGESQVKINGAELNSGVYVYTLILEGQVIDTKQMILTE
ncbi:MAG: tail fiber domain-containing protein [Crocinitomicaceae bacterium]|nr:tail fiber domain-containing protein [Crocinitomicaceae bacterium]